ncbi:MAG: GGDEF domain-containing protein [Pseudomonadota bacterium]
MTIEKRETPPTVEAKAVKLALGKSKQIKTKVEGCAEHLSSANQQFKDKLAQGDTELPAQAVLADTTVVEAKVQECVLDLHDVNELLRQGVDDLKHSELALEKSRVALADSKAALANATASETMAHHKALHDGLTGLPTRELFKDRLVQAIAVAERHGWSLAVMFLDLDHFKAINDTHGHAAGDAVLQAVAKRLTARCRDEDTISRFGGDEFLFLLVNPQGRDNIEAIAHSILKGVALPIDFGTLRLVTKASIGISVFPDDGLISEELIHLADKAMYRAKRQRLGICFSATAVAA